MTAEQLLQELEVLTYATRILHMVDLGRNAAHNTQIASALASLEQGDFYQRFLALYACFGSRDGAHVLRALTDPSRIIRGVAINLTPLVCDEAQLWQALEVVPREGRRSLLWKLHHHGYDALVNHFLEQLAEIHDHQLRELLPCGSSTLVRQHIAHIQPSMGLADWRRLTRHHPVIAFELLLAKAKTATCLDLQLVAFVNGIISILANKLPDQALILVKTLARSMPLSRIDLHALLLQRPTELADLILQGEDPGEIDFTCVAHRLDGERLLALREKHLASPGLVHIQRTYLKSAEHSPFSPAFLRFLRDEKGCLPVKAVTLLPRAQREQEGRWHLELTILATHPEKRLPYAAFLPWDEAHSILEPFLHDPSEKLRTLAIKTLTQVARYEHARLPAILAIIRSHLYEPDPIREAMLRGLKALPRGIWHQKPLEDLDQIVQGIAAAADTSANTVGALLLLLTKLLTCAPEWSATRFAQVLQAHHFVFRTGDMDTLSAGDIRLLGPALQPVLNALARKGEEETLLALRATFRKHLRVFDELLNALELALGESPSVQFGNMILSLLIKHRPARAAQLIPKLIIKNEGKITYPAILLYLHTYRQDLLTPLLARQWFVDPIHRIPGKTQERRRRRRKTRFLMDGFARWTTQQQTIFAQALLQVIDDTTSPHPMIKQAIARLAALPAIPTRHLIALTQNQRPVVRDTALILLRKLDDATQVLPTLLAALHDERAVRAVYALRPWLLTISPQRALDILHVNPFTRVTIAKEVVRLLGDLPGEEAFRELLALDGQELHRDVRVALMRALWRHIGRDEAWYILERETRSSDKVLALSTVRLGLGHALAKTNHMRNRFLYQQLTNSNLSHLFWFAEWNTITMTRLSGEHLSLLMQRRLMRLFALLLARPEADLRDAVLRNCTRLPAADEDQVLLTRLLEAMDTDNQEMCRAAASAIFGTCVASDAPRIEQAIERLLPNRRAILEIVPVLEQTLPTNRQQLTPVVRAVITALTADPLTIEWRVELAMVALPWDEVTTLLIEAAATETLHADALQQACTTLGFAIGKYGRSARPDSEGMFHLEMKLAASHDERLRRIALAALVAQAEEPNGWDKEQRSRLQIYRADPSVLVAAAAQFTMLPDTEA